jgi:1,4-dihydroxy-2-naphthoate octaprenyltransferase
VIVGIGVAIGAHQFSPFLAILAALVAIFLQIGVNFANDYSDGIRGTDLNRVGPVRLTASGRVKPAIVRGVAFVAFGLAAIAGLGLVWLSSTWPLLAVGVLAILAAWYYTGGKKPYGYAGLGELMVFVFFGLVATLGTVYTQIGSVTVGAVLAASGIGLLAVAILLINNIRDLATDKVAGKYTLPTRLGDRRSRRLYMLVIVGALVIGLIIAALYAPWAWLLLLLSGPVAMLIASVRLGVSGPKLIPMLGRTSLLELAYGVILGVAFALA